IFEVAEHAGLDLRGRGDKRQLRCPFHSDKHPSAFINGKLNCFGCSVCALHLNAKNFAAWLGVPWPPSSLSRQREAWFSSPPTTGTWQRKFEREEPSTFPPTMAQEAWTVALERARTDRQEELAADAMVHRYLARRGLGLAFELGAV